MPIVLAHVTYQLATLVDWIKEAKRHQLAVAVKCEEPAHVGLLYKHERLSEKSRLTVANHSSLLPRIGDGLNLINANFIKRAFARDEPALYHAIEGLTQELLLAAIESVARELDA